MNIIEHVWDQIDHLVRSHDPLPCNCDKLWEALQEEWENFPQEALDKLYESMPRRVTALIAAQGGNTKYWIFYSKIFFHSFTIGHLFQPIADVQKNCTPPSRFTYSAFALGSFIWLKLYYIHCTTCLATVDTSLHIEILFPSYLRRVTSLLCNTFGRRCSTVAVWDLLDNLDQGRCLVTNIHRHTDKRMHFVNVRWTAQEEKDVVCLKSASKDVDLIFI